LDPTPGLKPDPAIEEWLRRQQAKRGEAWPQAAEMLAAFRSAIATLEEAVRDCPEELWQAQVWEVRPSDPWMSPPDDAGAPTRSVDDMQVFGRFWYVAFHCIFFLDYYLSQLDAKPYRGPKPFGGPNEHDVDQHRVAILPFREYTREQLLSYLDRGKQRAEKVLGALTVEDAARPCPPTSSYGGQAFSELLGVTLEHVREHGAQLSAALGRGT
jgi:DinB family protein